MTKAMHIEQIEKLTRDLLRSLPYDEERAYHLPTARDLLNGTSLAYRSQYLMDSRFSIRCNYERSIIRITRKRPGKEADDGAE